MPTPTIFEGINPRGTQTLIPCKDAKAQNGIIANTKLIKDTVGWTNKNIGKYVNQSLVGDSTAGFNLVSGGSSLIAKLEHNKDYIVKRKSGQGDRFRVVLFINAPSVMSPDTSASQAVFDNTKNEYTISSGNYNYAVFTYVSSSSTAISQDTAEAMIRDADILDPTYEPYFGSTAFPRSEQAVLGAYNIINNIMETHEESGVTFTVNVDKSVSLSGTSSGSIGGHDSSYKNYNVCWSLTNLKKGRYKLIGCPPNGSGSTYRLIISNLGTTVFVTDTGDGAVFDYDPNANDPWVYCYIRINEGQNMTGKVFKPMITTDLNATYDDYVAPAMTNKELTELATSKEITATIHISATDKITIASSTHMFKKSGIVCGSLRIAVAQALTAGQSLVTLSEAPENTIFTIGIDTSDGSTMPVIINGSNGIIQLFGDFNPPVGHNLIMPINFVAK